MAYDVKLLLNIAARFESASTYTVRAGDAAMGNQRDNIGEALRIARGAIEDLEAHVATVIESEPVVEDVPGYTSKGARLLQSVTMRKGRQP